MTAPGTPARPPGDLDDLEARARALLRANTRRGYDPYYRVQYQFVRPSPGRYNWQWHWDSCFHAIAAARLDPDLARSELRALVAAQDPDGFIGHLTYWGRLGALASAAYMQGRLFQWRRRHSAMIQPPLLPQAIEAVYAATEDAAFVAELLPAAEAFYAWLGAVRDPDGIGLIAIISPFESGLDNSPAYDEALGLRNPGRLRVLLSTRFLDLSNALLARNFSHRAMFQRDRFVVYDTLVNAVYADGLRTLAKLRAAVGDEAGAARHGGAADRVEAALNTLCWDDSLGYYTHLSGRQRKPLRTLTVSALLPAFLDTTPAARRETVVRRHLTNPGEFWLKLPAPSVARSEPSFDPSGDRMIWRGPTAMNVNWLVVRGLRRYGYSAEADHIAGQSRAFVSRHGFREFYNPLTGEGMRGERFGWATVVVAM